ncbi:hypothetical protein REC12_26045 [Desulfosporosinus sp. PR]|nr:hypothetical protein [Desulfosporosinus sp. PR]MDQ7097062.1 hypothetical protein [Desulfosporosinus sp. PR]
MLLFDEKAGNGAVMSGMDYVNWHGIYDQNKALAQMQADAIS